MVKELSHFEALARLLELERAAERTRLAEEKASLPLGELEERGLVLLDLESTEESIGLGGRVLVTFERADRQPFRSSLSPGDLVELRPRKADTEHPAAAVVSRATRKFVQLAFDRSPPLFVREGRLRLDLVANDVSFERAKSAVVKVAAWERGREHRRRDVLLGAEAASFERTPEFSPTRPLNPEQREAVAQALAAQDFFLVHGPPGTGKSTVLAEVAVQAVRQGARLLCTAASNAAVDHLLELCLDTGLRSLRVGHPARVLPHLVEHTLDVVVEEHPDRVLARELFDEGFELLGYARRQRARGRSRQRFAKARASSAEAYQLFDEARALEKKAVASVLSSAQVVCATLSMLDAQVLADARFGLCLLDEATQATEPASLAAFLKAERVVLAGDHKQLPPTVVSPEAARAGLEKSLFERLLEDQGERVKQMLREQYRMNEALMAFPSREMYAGELRAHPTVAKRTLAQVCRLEAPPLLFLDTAGKGFSDETDAPTKSFRNEGEARLLAARAKELLDAGLSPRELAVIAPYRAQVALLRELIAHDELEIDTVDAFQGREKDAVLLCLTRSNDRGELGFLTDLRRMNVAMTRARRHLFVVGDSATVGAHPFYARFIEEAQAQNGYQSAWEWP
ncbi:MAG: AAA domain-containing protein [Myxococcota bacterium]